MTIKCDWVKRYSLVAIGFAASAVSPAIGDIRPPEMFARLDTGRWELRLRGNGDHVERVCMQGAGTLIQLRHPNLLCEKVIIDDSPSDVTVQYTCRGHGYGRTHIRRESGRLIQIETQGIVGGLPFDFAAEGRRVGDC